MKGLIQLRVDARSLVQRNPQRRGLRPTSLALGFNFSTPFTPLKWFDGSKDEDELDENGEEKDDAGAAENYDEEPELEIHAAIGGAFKRMFQTVTLVDENGEEEDHKVSTLFCYYVTRSDVCSLNYPQLLCRVALHLERH